MWMYFLIYKLTNFNENEPSGPQDLSRHILEIFIPLPIVIYFDFVVDRDICIQNPSEQFA